MALNKLAPIRVVLCSYPSIFTEVVYQELLGVAAIEVVGLVQSTRVFTPTENFFQVATRMLKVSGLNYTLMQFLQTDMYVSLKKIFCAADQSKLPILRTKNINNAKGMQFLQELNADVILLAHFNQKLAPVGINLARCLNLHPGILPDYKGVDPVFAALNANETKLGVSLHQVDTEFDTGAILRQQQILVETEKCLFYHQVKLFQLGAKLAVQEILQATIATPQTSTGRYDSWPTKKQVKDFKHQGKKLMSLKSYVQMVKTCL